MAHRATTVLGRFAGHCQDQRNLLGRELAEATTAGQVAEEFFDGLSQGPHPLAAFHEDQPLEGLSPAPPPNPHAMAFAAEALGNLLGAQSFKSQQNQVSPQHQTLGTGALACHCL
jgi:hypothetical protein